MIEIADIEDGWSPRLIWATDLDGRTYRRAWMIRASRHGTWGRVNFVLGTLQRSKGNKGPHFTTGMNQHWYEVAADGSMSLPVQLPLADYIVFEKMWPRWLEVHKDHLNATVWQKMRRKVMTVKL